MSVEPVLIAGEWRAAKSSSAFQAENPRAAEPMPQNYPVSEWSDCDQALDAAASAFAEMQKMAPSQIAKFLECYADRIEARAEEICRTAADETALAYEPRLAGVELPRTTGQLRQAAAAAREGSWTHATIDTASGIRSYYSAIGPVAVFGPNNFPFAFGSISGGDFAAAIAAGNPVIGKANSMHPRTTQCFAEEARAAAEETGMPAAIVQLLYRLDHADGARLVSDPRLGATGYTGSRSAGLQLKAAADKAGKPIYLELSSVNPVVILPGALSERFDAIVDDFSGSCLMGTGQFCTNPGFVLLIGGEQTDSFVDAVQAKFTAAPVGTLLSRSGVRGLSNAIQTLQKAGAEVLVGGTEGGGQGASFANTLMRVNGKDFLANAEALQTEAFGNASLIVIAEDVVEAREVLGQLEGNLTGCIYSHTGNDDDESYDQLVGPLRLRVGRLINDKMPTGVAVSAAMNHGGPFPATGHPGFTAVGIPASLSRFAMLQSFDQVRPHRLPSLLQDKNPSNAWRLVDGQWTQDDIQG